MFGPKPTHFTAVLLCTAALALGGASAHAQEIAGVTPPPTMTVAGQELKLAGCGSKEKLWIDAYAVALYLPPGQQTDAAASDGSVAKAIRLYPTYEGELPEDIPGDWGERLSQRLSPEHMEMLRTMYGHMTTDTVATITFAPGSGTSVKVDGEQVGSTEGSDLMQGVLETWLGQGTPLDLIPTC